MKLKPRFKFIFVLLLFFIAFFTTSLAYSQIRAKDHTTPPHPTTSKEIIDEELVTATSEATLGMIGDILLHYPIYTYPDFNFAFENVKEQMEGIDMLIANQESMPAGDTLGLSTYPSFNSPPHIIRDLQHNGVDFVTIANNHTLDKGENQVLLSIENLKQYNMPYTGAFSSEEDKQQARIMHINDISVGILAYTYGTNTFGTAHPDNKSYLVSYLEEEQVLKDIKDLRSHADFIVLSLHWGEEYNTDNNDDQRQLATTFFDAGADAIFGHHPHVLQPFEWINNKPVFYSLGNFYSAQPWAGTNVGGIGRISIRKTVTGELSKIETTAANFFPTTVTRDVYNGAVDSPAFRVLPLERFGNQMGWDTSFVEQHLGLQSW